MKITRSNTLIMRERQMIVSEALDERKLSRKLIAFDADIPYNTFIKYFPTFAERDPTEMPAGALAALCDAKSMPKDLVSLLFSDGVAVVPVPVDLDYDQIADWAETFNAKKLAAHRADSECQEQIGPSEHAELGSIVVSFPAAANG